MNTPAKLNSQANERSERSAQDNLSDNKVTPISAALRARVQGLGVSAKPNAERPKILFLDDEERILNALSALFRYKYQVFTATDGEQALAILREHHVHVVVSDQRMPKMTGVEFLRRAKEISPNTMRILLTGFSDLSAIIDSVNDGEVYRFLNKPWGNQEIQAMIADALSIGLELDLAAKSEKTTGLEGRSNGAADPDAGTLDRPAIVMMQNQRVLFEQIHPLMGDGYRCLYAQKLDECLDALATKNVAVVVCDLHVGQKDSSDLLKLLKREHPQILTIVLANSADADNVIELINQAKIFRYVLTPCKPQKLKFFIESAVTQFQRYKSNPALLKVQRADTPQQMPESRTNSLILERLQSIRAFFAPRTSTTR